MTPEQKSQMVYHIAEKCIDAMLAKGELDYLYPDRIAEEFEKVYGLIEKSVKERTESQADNYLDAAIFR